MTISYEDGRRCTVYGAPSGECVLPLNHEGRHDLRDLPAGYVCTDCGGTYATRRSWLHHPCPESLGGVSA